MNRIHGHSFKEKPTIETPGNLECGDIIPILYGHWLKQEGKKMRLETSIWLRKKSGMCRTLTAKAHGADGVCDSGRRVHQEGLQAGPCPGCVRVTSWIEQHKQGR